MITSEQGIWEHVGKCWRKPETMLVGGRDDHKKPTPAILPTGGENVAYGLCRSLAFLHEGRGCDLLSFRDARKRLDEYLRKSGWLGGYLFSLTSEGAAKRAALCEQFADVCKRENEVASFKKK